MYLLHWNMSLNAVDVTVTAGHDGCDSRSVNNAVTYAGPHSLEGRGLSRHATTMLLDLDRAGGGHGHYSHHPRD